MFSNDRSQMRRVFTEAWRKHREGLPLEPLEHMLAASIAQHPEYHRLIEQPDAALERDFLPEGGETNPFLHMGMHISLQEQLQTQRPAGIVALYQQLCVKTGDAHSAEHQMMECLGQALWEAQRHQRPPDEQAYLRCLRALVEQTRR